VLQYGLPASVEILKGAIGTRSLQLEAEACMSSCNARHDRHPSRVRENEPIEAFYRWRPSSASRLGSSNHRTTCSITLADAAMASSSDLSDFLGAIEALWV